MFDEEICFFFLLVFFAAKGDEPHERGKQGAEEHRGTNIERLQRFTDETRQYPAK